MPIQESVLPPQSITVFPKTKQNELAWQDIKDGLEKWPVWLMLAYQDIKLRYRRSVLGPFWLTISMAITVYSMGFLYAHLFHQQLENYYPFLVAGMLSWSLVSSIVIDLTEGFSAADTLIKQIKLPYTLYIHRICARNVLIFFHNIIVMIPIYFLYRHSAKINWHSLFLIPGVFIIYLNAITYGIILGMVGARYRDISQIIKSFIQVIFFITPVMWDPSVLGARHYFIVDLNPFYAFLQLIRQPLLGGLPSFKNLLLVMGITGCGAWWSMWLFTRYRSRIVYWI